MHAMNRVRRLLPYVSAPPGGRFAAAAVLLGALALLAGCGERRELTPSGQSGELPDQEVQDFAITETDAGTVEWKLFAQQAAMFDVKNTITARGVRVDFYDDEGKQSSRLKARS